MSRLIHQFDRIEVSLGKTKNQSKAAVPRLNPLAFLNSLIKALQDHDVPSPQLFRLEEEFNEPLENDDEKSVRDITEKSISLDLSGGV
jgi:hypothetical protein